MTEKAANTPLAPQPAPAAPARPARRKAAAVSAVAPDSATGPTKKASRKSTNGASGVRAAQRGDVAPSAQGRKIETFVAAEATQGAQATQVEAMLSLLDGSTGGDSSKRAAALRAMLEGASSDDLGVLRAALTGKPAMHEDKQETNLKTDRGEQKDRSAEGSSVVKGIGG